MIKNDSNERNIFFVVLGDGNRSLLNLVSSIELFLIFLLLS